MARISGGREAIDGASVRAFFEERARKAEQLGALRAVTYQDRHPNLAEQRDAAEKALLLPKLDLRATDRVLDVGCGTGRWTAELTRECGSYCGADASPGLVDVARNAHSAVQCAHFVVCPIEQLSLQRLGVSQPFTRIVCVGVLMYVNDDGVAEGLRAMLACAAPQCRILIREPLGIQVRLTLKEHFSDEMQQTYNAVYRTEAELVDLLAATLLPAGFVILEQGDVYRDPTLNNRTETRQRYVMLAR